MKLPIVQHRDMSRYTSPITSDRQERRNNGRAQIEAPVGVRRILGPLKESFVKFPLDLRDRIGWKRQS